MSPRLPRITAKKLIPFVEKRGSVFVQQRGSHRIYRGPGGKRFPIPCHAGKIIRPKTLKSILKAAEFSVEELQELL